MYFHAELQFFVQCFCCIFCILQAFKYTVKCLHVSCVKRCCFVCLVCYIEPISCIYRRINVTWNFIIQGVSTIRTCSMIILHPRSTQTVKYYFCAGNFSCNYSCAEMKAEHLRKFRKFGVSRWSEMAFSVFSLPLFAKHVREKINHLFIKNMQIL
jgi:hypothetical protein